MNSIAERFIRYILILQQPIYYFCKAYILFLQGRSKRMNYIEYLYESGDLPERYYN